MAALASFSGRAYAMRMAPVMCGHRLAMPGLSCRGARICRPATRTTCRFPVSSWLRPRPEYPFHREACLKSGAALRRKAANSLLPGTRECRSMPLPKEKKTMNNNQSRREFCATAIATILASATSVKAAEKKYDTGANDTEIKIGQTVPHSGPGALYGVLGRVGEGLFQMLNEKTAINRRESKVLTVDDPYSPPES